MGAETSGAGGAEMRLLMQGIFAACLWLYPANGICGEQDEHLSKWLELLKKGNAQEKQLALRNLESSEEPVLAALTDKDPNVREAAAAFWQKTKARPQNDNLRERIAAALARALQDPSPAVRAEAAKSLRYYADQHAVDALTQRLHDKDTWVRLNAVYTLGELGLKYWAKSVGGRPPSASGLSVIEVDDKKQLVPEQASEIAETRKDLGPEIMVTRKLVVRSPNLNLTNAITPMVELLEKDDDWREVFVQQEIIIALSKMNVQDEKVASLLLRKFDQTYLKIHIIEALGHLGVPAAEQVLLKSLQDNDYGIRIASLNALSMLGINWEAREKDDIISACRDGLKKPSAEARMYAVRVLGKMVSRERKELLVQALSDKDDQVVKAAIEELIKVDDKELLKDLLAFFKNGNKSLREAAIKAYQQIAEKTATDHVYAQRNGVKVITGKVQSPNLAPGTRRMRHPEASGLLLAEAARGETIAKISVLSIIGEYEDDRIESQLILLLDDKAPEVRKLSSELFKTYGTDQSVPALIKALKSSDKTLKFNAIFALEVIGDNRAKNPLLELLKDNDDSVRHYALRALKKYNDSAITDATLQLIRGEKSDFARSQAAELLKDKHDPRALKLMLSELTEYWGASEFTATDFNSSHSLARLTGVLMKDGLADGQETIEDINKVLDRIDLLNEVLRRKGIQTISTRLEVLKQRYIKSRRQSDLRILNRAILEEFYPADCPKKKPDKTGRIPTAAVNYLGEIGDKKAVEPVLDILENEIRKGCGIDDPNKLAVVASLGKLKDQRPVQAMIQILSCKNSSLAVKEETIRSLTSLKSRQAVPALRSTLQDDRVATLAIRALGEMGDEQALDDIKAKLYQDTHFRSDAVKAIIRLNAERSGDILAELVMQSPPSIDDKAIFEYMQNLQRKKALRLFLQISGKLERLDRRVKTIVEIMKQYGKKKIIRELSGKINDDDREIRRGAVTLLGEFREKDCLAMVKRFLKDSDPGIRRVAQDSLEVIEAQFLGNNSVASGGSSEPGSQSPSTDVPREAIVWSQPLTLTAASWAFLPMAIQDENLFAAGAIASRNTGVFALNENWRLEKRRLADGLLVSEFGNQGEVTSDAVGRISGLAVDQEHIYLLGRHTIKDKSTNLVHFEWIEKRYAKDGLLAPEFGEGGIVKREPAAGSRINEYSVIDMGGDYIYTAGYFDIRNPLSNLYLHQSQVEKRMKKTGQLVPEFGHKGILTIDSREILALAIDAHYLYIAAENFIGIGDSRWCIEKRSLDNGALMPSFELDGIVTTNPSKSLDKIHAIAVGGEYLYIVGSDMAPGNNAEWRIEKRNVKDGSSVDAFGNHGVIVNNPSAGADWAMSLAFDPSGNFMYVIGKDQVDGSRSQRWRIEMRKTYDGSLVSNFGMKGIMTYKPSSDNGVALGILQRDDFLYVAGTDGEKAQLLKIRK